MGRGGTCLVVAEAALYRVQARLALSGGRLALMNLFGRQVIKDQLPDGLYPVPRYWM